MAITVSEQLRNAMTSPERYGVAFFTFIFSTGTYGLWTAGGEQTYNGILYRAGGSLLEVDDIEHNADGSVAEMSIGLSEAPDKGITWDLMQTFFEEDWHLGEIVVQLGYMNPNTNTPIGVFTVFAGNIFQAPEKEGPKAKRIDLRCVGRSIKLSENGGNYRNQASQALLDPSDTGLVGIGNLNGSVVKELKWGQA